MGQVLVNLLIRIMSAITLIPLLTWLLLSSIVLGCEKYSDKTHVKTIIVGAGPSGVAAATKLKSNGLDDFIILEAENRIGGRVHSVPYVDDYTLDMGAQWVHGQVGNVVYEMAKEFNLVENGKEYENFENHSIYVSSTKNKVVDKKVADTIVELVFSYVEEEDGLANYTGSLGEYIVERLYEDLPEYPELRSLQNLTIEEFLKFSEKLENSQDASDSWFDTSASGLDLYEECPGPQDTIWKKGGYGNVLKLLKKEFPGQNSIDICPNLLLNKEVVNINHEKEGVVKVVCADGTQYTAEKVLVTVSLGVLKERKDAMFKPSLPKWKTRAIDGLGFGQVNKIFIRFPVKWWPDNFSGFKIIWTAEDESNRFPDIGKVNGKSWVADLGYFARFTEDPMTFAAFIVGPSARYSETLSDEQVKKDLMTLFRGLLEPNYKIPEPDRITRSKWFTNNHFRGSYSFHSMKTDELNTNATELSKPIVDEKGKPKILFAGEATNQIHYSTVHGAVESGWREADRLIQLSKA